MKQDSPSNIPKRPGPGDEDYWNLVYSQPTALDFVEVTMIKPLVSTAQYIDWYNFQLWSWSQAGVLDVAANDFNGVSNWAQIYGPNGRGALHVEKVETTSMSALLDAMAEHMRKGINGLQREVAITLEVSKDSNGIVHFTYDTVARGPVVGPNNDGKSYAYGSTVAHSHLTHVEANGADLPNLRSEAPGHPEAALWVLAPDQHSWTFYTTRQGLDYYNMNGVTANLVRDDPVDAYDIFSIWLGP